MSHGCDRTHICDMTPMCDMTYIRDMTHICDMTHMRYMTYIHAAPLCAEAGVGRRWVEGESCMCHDSYM